MLNRPRLEAMLGEFRELKEDALRAVQFRMGAMTENMAFYRGLQYGWRTPHNFIVDMEGEDGIERKVMNYVRPAVRSNVALLLRSIPNIRVVSAQEGPQARARAKRTDRLVQSMRRNGMLPYDVFFDGEIDVAVKGAGFYKVFWNPRAGKMTKVPSMKPTSDGGWSAELDDGGEPQETHRFEGALAVEYVDMIDALPDPHASCEAEIRHIFHRKLIPVSTLESAYPKDAFGQKTKGRFAVQEKEATTLSRDAIQGTAADVVSPVGTTRSDGNQACEMTEVWVRPCEEWPGGLLLIYAADVILGVTDELPYEWPWVLRIGANRVPRSIFSDGVVADLRAMQRLINDAFTRSDEIMALATAPKILNPSTSGIRPEVFDARVGQVITYEPRGALRPEWWNPPAIPPSLASLGSDAIQMLRDVAAVSDVTDTSGLQTGRALAYLEENKKGVLEPEVQSWREAYARIIKLALGVLRDFMPEDRLIVMMGETNTMVAQRFKRDDFDFDAFLVLEQDEGPSSRAVRSADALQMLQAGALTDDPAAIRFRRLAGREWVDQDPFDDAQVHRERALREAADFISDPWGAPPQLVPEDDHEIHAKEHQLAAVDGAFLALPPALQEQWRAHIAEHEAQYVEQQQAQQAMTPPPGAGAPSPPGRPQAPSPFDGGVSDSAAGLQTPETAPQ